MEFLLFTAIAFIYLLPSVIAGHRQHTNGVPLFIVNLASGWTLVGWVGCLAWSFSGNKTSES